MGVLGAAREWESFLVDLGSPSDPAATPAERSASVWRALGVDAGQIYGPASAARFSPSQPPRGTAAQTWNAVAAAKATVGWRRRALAGLRLRSLRA